MAVKSGRSTRSLLFCCQFVTNELPASPACHSILAVRSPVVPFGHGRSSSPSAEVPRPHPAVGELRATRIPGRAAEPVHAAAEGELVHHPRWQQVLADPLVDA